MGKKESKNGFVTSPAERRNYSLYFLGQGICYALVYMFLQTYALDVGIQAITFAGVALIIKVWDAVNDPIFGVLLEKVHLKGGKYMPWIKISIVAIPLTSVLVFAIPNSLPMGAKIAWCVIAYMLWDAAYTIGDVPIYALSTAMANNPKERTALISYGRFFRVFSMLAAAVLIPIIRTPLGGWTKTAVVLCIFGMVVMIPVVFKTKERYVVRDNTTKDPTFKEMGTYLVKNKYMLIFYIALIVYFTTQISSTLGLILARINFGSESVSSLISLFSMGPWVVCALLVPVLTKKIDKFILFYVSLVLGIFMNLVIYIAGYGNVGLFLILILIKGFCTGFGMTLAYTFIGDCCEYSTYKTGIDAKGVGFAAHTFFTKFMTATQTALSSLLLGLMGYIETEGATQVTGFSDKLWILYTLVPMIGGVISIAIFWQYKLRDKDVAIITNCNRGLITREEAEATLSRKY